MKKKFTNENSEKISENQLNSKLLPNIHSGLPHDGRTTGLKNDCFFQTFSTKNLFWPKIFFSENEILKKKKAMGL